jgi:hypothetical protein
MFKTIRGKLVGDIADEQISIDVKTKLQTFLQQNPDVDHYIDDTTTSRYRTNFWLGIFFGVVVGIFVATLVIMTAMNVWTQLGFLHLPGYHGW